MRLEEIITENNIDLNLKANTKVEAIEKLVKLLFEDGRVEAVEPFLNDVLDREKIEPTDMGIGVAIPHGISDIVTRPSVAIGRLKEPFFWEGAEESEKPIFAVFLLASSKKIEGNDHLEMISKIATLLIDDDFIEILKMTSSKTTLFEAIQTFLGGMS